MKRINIEADASSYEARAALVASERGWGPLVSATIGRSYERNNNRLAVADAWAEVADAHLFASDGGRWTPAMLRRLRMVWPENRPGPIVPVYVAYDSRCKDWRVLERPEAARLLGWPSPWASGDPAAEEAATLAAAAKMAAPVGGDADGWTVIDAKVTDPGAVSISCEAPATDDDGIAGARLAVDGGADGEA